MIRAVSLPPQALLHEELNYNRDSGIFTWKPARSGRRRRSCLLIDNPAGTISSNGYIRIRVGSTIYAAHRLAWVYVHGDTLGPLEELDHVNGDRADNRICNLRRATKSDNMANMRGHSKIGLPKGVSVQSISGRFIAAIMKHRKKLYLGTFDTPEEAHAAYVAAAVSLRGEFARAE